MMRAVIVASLLAAACREQPEHRAFVRETPAAMRAPAALAIDLGDGLSSPEAAVHDPIADVYLVSNIQGGPHELDDNGYISRISPDGTMIDERWIDGANPDVTLHAPRGMAIHGSTLYVVDADAVRLFDRVTGHPRGEWPVPDAKFPNDLRVADDGTVYATDTAIHLDGRGATPDGTATIWKFSADGQPTVLARGDDLNGPNGIVLAPDGPIVASYLGNEVYQVRDGHKVVRATLPGALLDGLIELPDRSLLVTSWTAHSIFQVEPDGSYRVALHDLSLLGPASIAYDRTRERLIVPLVLANMVVLEPLPARALPPTSGKSDATGIIAR